MNRTYRALFGAVFLGCALSGTPAFAEESHSDVPPTKGESRTVDKKLGEWEKKVAERTNGAVLTGLDSDTFLEREASTAEAHRRVAAGKLSMRELFAAWPPGTGGRSEVSKRLERIFMRAIAEERHLQEALRLLAAKDTPAAMQQVIDVQLKKIPELTWLELAARLRQAVVKKRPAKMSTGIMLENVLHALSDASVKQMKVDAELAIDEKATDAQKKAAASRTQAALEAAVKKLGYVLEKAEPDPKVRAPIAILAFREPKGRADARYVMEVAPYRGLTGAIRVHSEVSLTAKEIVPGTVRLANGEWASKGLPATSRVETGQFATGTPGEIKKFYEKEPDPERLEIGEYQWLRRSFKSEKDTKAIDRALGIESL